ncbi:hypothetical protein [Pseudomonas sp.]|uniref:hypothetical protein n=1 Tax=Pseudomonas sp. TaxID=306 RepID=UPI0029092D76|nr:hypothetical protein [Pseudomonas sp.]MDU4255816.1 hypothetical protein [Pseudomonas sp.]
MIGSVRLVGQERARAQLAARARSVDPVIRGAVNATATAARRERYTRKMMGTFLSRQFLNSRMKIKRANSKRLNARVIPSSSSVMVLNYKTWGFDPIDATRAVIWVRGLNGKKVAAGFVNPSSRGRLPWATRSERAGRSKNYRYEWSQRRLAMGPSVAHWFRQLTDAATINWTNAFLQQEFERRMRREIAKHH